MEYWSIENFPPLQYSNTPTTFSSCLCVFVAIKNMTRFLEEVQELPEALLRMVSFYKTDGRERLLAWAQKTQECYNKVLFSGMGTSEFAPIVVRSKMAAAGVTCDTIDAGEWLHYRAAGVSGNERLVVLISQSGESVEIKRLIEEKFVKPGFVGLTNYEESTLGTHADLVLPICAGNEASISTKTYTNTLGALYLMAAALQGEEAIALALSELERTADCLFSADEKRIIEAAEILHSGNAVAFVGRGPAYVAAKQSALTFMEGTKRLIISFSGGAFRHGPFECLDKDFRAVFLMPKGRTFSINQKMAQEAAKLGARVVCFTDADIQEKENIQVIRLKNVESESSEELFPLVMSGAQALLLHHFAKLKGIEAGQFRYCSKVTSQE